MEYLGDVSKKVEDFIRKSDQFQTACNSAFDQVDVRGLGSIPISHVALATVYFFRVGFAPLLSAVFACMHACVPPTTWLA